MPIGDAYHWFRNSSIPKLDGFVSEQVLRGDQLYLPCMTASQKNEHSELSMLYTIVSVYIGATLIAGVLGLFTRNAIHSQRTWLEKMGMQPKKVKKLNCWGLRSVRKKWPAVKAALILVAWTLIGATMYVFVDEKASFLQGLYFAVTSASTAGLQQIPTTRLALGLITIYCLVGVPLYAYLLVIVPFFFSYLD